MAKLYERKKLLLSILGIFIFTGCSIKDVVAKNKESITIHYGGNDKIDAFKIAEEHCNSVGKSAIIILTTPELGNNFTSTWNCK